MGSSIQSIIQNYLARYRAVYPLSPQQAKVAGSLSACRTEQLGRHGYYCDSCDYRGFGYNSCRDRHCPRCQYRKQQQWVADRVAELLPVSYFHVVFTLSSCFDAFFQQNPKLMFDLFFRCMAETLQTFAADPKFLGARIGFIAILHTWGQTLSYHPHLHVIVPAGGLTSGGEWVESKYAGKFLFPVKAMSRMFKGKFLEGLQMLYPQLTFNGSIEHLRDRQLFDYFLLDRRRDLFRIFSKAPFGNAEAVVKYLGRYTHRVAIANSRILEVTDDGVEFSYRDYRDGGKTKTLRLNPVEFLRRFLSHVLPKGFQKIRSYGFLAGSIKTKMLTRIRQALKVVADSVKKAVLAMKCPTCKKGNLLFIRDLKAISIRTDNLLFSTGSGASEGHNPNFG